ncbi:uncharacterized protein LOC131152702 isoform X2 [Malania oleifera]|uniref:uncharacterized protein LOC131152702 isoform X2 n=1 Tax=Malania oleifera TaxID=397392 RepID=UPI0025AE160C|nr:uncharacterized protein LOC131152702 isoform X2 [Malania oleifera]
MVAMNTITSSFSFPCSISFFPALKTPPSFPSLSPFIANCSHRTAPDPHISTASAFAVLGVDPGCTPAHLKAAFRAKVKEFHPDVRKDGGDSETMIRRVIQAYELLSDFHKSDVIESCQECLDPFEDPECEAFDIFVNEVLCVGKACPYSCVKTAPHAFTFASSTGHGEDYQVQLAVGQCPRSCIHYVTPSQRIILEELLDSILSTPYDTSAEADLLYSLIAKGKFENNRYQKPKKQPKASTQHVDWF